MFLATLFSFCVGYLARLRHRWSDQVDKTTRLAPPRVNLPDLTPHVIVREGRLESTGYRFSPVYIKREFAISLFLKLGVLFLFAGVVWLATGLNLPVWSKWIMGALVCLVVWSVLRVLDSLGEWWSLTTKRNELLAGGSLYLLINLFTTTTDTFPINFTLLVVALLYLFYVERCHGYDWPWLIPALLWLALFEPLVLGAGPTVATTLYLVFISLVTVWSLLITPSHGTGLLLMLGLVAYTVTLGWYPTDDVSLPVLTLLGGAYLIVLYGLVCLLAQESHLWSWSALSLMVWFGAGGFSLGGLLPWPGLTFAVMTLLLALLAYRWADTSRSVNAPIFLAGLATLSLFLAATFLFSGFTLVSLYLVFVTVLLTLVTEFGLPGRVVWPSVGLFLVSVYLTLPATLSPAWGEGVGHEAAGNLYVLLGSLVWLSGWLLHRTGLSAYRWRPSLTLLFGFLTIITSYVVTAIVLGSSSYPSSRTDCS